MAAMRAIRAVIRSGTDLVDADVSDEVPVPG